MARSWHADACALGDERHAEFSAQAGKADVLAHCGKRLSGAWWNGCLLLAHNRNKYCI